MLNTLPSLLLRWTVSAATAARTPAGGATGFLESFRDKNEKCRFHPSFLPIRRVQRPLDFLFVALEKKRMQRRGVLACAVAAAILVPTHAALGRSDSDSPASTEGRCSPRMSPTASGAPQVRERRETTRVRELSLSAQGSPLTDRTLPSPISPRVRAEAGRNARALWAVWSSSDSGWNQ